MIQFPIEVLKEYLCVVVINLILVDFFKNCDGQYVLWRHRLSLESLLMRPLILRSALFDLFDFQSRKNYIRDYFSCLYDPVVSVKCMHKIVYSITGRFINWRKHKLFFQFPYRCNNFR